MDFSLTPEHEMTRRMVREFAVREVAPVIKEYDRAQEANLDVLARMAELGLLGICIPARYGGAGMDYVCLGLACEELERVDTSLRVVMSVHVGLNSLGLLQWSTEEQKQRWLVPQARGECYAAYALTFQQRLRRRARPAGREDGRHPRQAGGTRRLHRVDQHSRRRGAG
jgi:glutaryl-CoA dehydrogenase (non-decarboxylating)